MTDLLQLRGIAKHFGGIQALQGVSMSVPRGSLYGMIGPNGAGKTTLFNIITGFYRADAGQMQLAGQDLPAQLGPEARVALGIARTFQNIRLFSQMSVLDNVLVGRHRHTRSGLWAALLRTAAWRADESRQRQAALHCLQRVGLAARAHDIAAALSYGEQRRLEIARALATEPCLLALDEPAAGMNDAERAGLAELLLGLRADGLTLLLIEHDMPLIMQLCDRVLALDFGEVVIEADPQSVRRHPRVIAAYLGEEA